jgi:hypothetical protein
MATVSSFVRPCKLAPRAYRAHLYDAPGIVTTLDGAIVFVDDETEALTTIEPDMCPWVMVLGDIGISDTQLLMDRLHGNAVGVCVSRQQEVR